MKYTFHKAIIINKINIPLIIRFSKSLSHLELKFYISKQTYNLVHVIISIYKYL